MKNDIKMSRSFLSASDREIEKIEQSACLSGDLESVAHDCTRAIYKAGFDWLTHVIMRPHADLGRQGAVCPFARPAHQERSIVFCVWDVSELPFDIFISVLKKLPVLHHRRSAEKPEKSRLLSICVFLTGLQEEQYRQYIDDAHTMVKPVFMRAGLMIGEFHPLSKTPGAHSKAFQPMRSNQPAFVIRAITPHDAIFIDREDSPAEVRLRELSDYRSWVGAVLPDDQILTIDQRIAELRSVIAHRD